MEIIEWEDKFSIGNDDIDSQHKGLFEILNSIVRDTFPNVRSPVLEALFKKFEEYADKHFSFEQDYMKQIDYPGYEVQVKQHEYYMKKLSDLMNDRFTVPHDLHDFLRMWLVNHVLKCDGQIREYVKTMGRIKS